MGRASTGADRPESESELTTTRKVLADPPVILS